MNAMNDRLRRAIAADAARARSAPVTWMPPPIDLRPPVVEPAPADSPARANGAPRKPCGCGGRGGGGIPSAQAQLVQQWLATVQRMAHGLTLAPRDDVTSRLFRFIVGRMAWYMLRARPALRTLTGGFLFWTSRGRATMRERNTICAACPRRAPKNEAEGVYAALFLILAALGVGGAVVAAACGVATPLALLCMIPCVLWAWAAFPRTERNYCGACGCPAWIGSRLSVKNACVQHRCPEGKHGEGSERV